MIHPLKKFQDQPGFQTCTKCKTVYPLHSQYFQPDKQYKSGFASWCRQCKYRGKRQWVLANRPAVRPERNIDKMPRGSRHYAAKLKEEQVKQIIELLEILPIREIAERYGVSRQTIHSIDSCKNWKHI